MLAERSYGGTTITLVFHVEDARLEFSAEVTELVKIPDHLEWNRCMGVADDDVRRTARRELKKWVSQNLGIVQEMIDSVQAHRLPPTEEEKKRSAKFRFWVNVWHKLFLFNHGLADKPASRAIAVLSAAGGVAMFLSPDDVTFRTPRGWLALAFSVLSAIVLAPLLLQWLIARIWRRYG